MTFRQDEAAQRAEGQRPTGSRGAGTVWTDIALGMRLAQAGRGTRLRITLSGFGIGMCVAVLLLAASLAPAMESRSLRADAAIPHYLSPSWQGLAGPPATASLVEPGTFEAHDSEIPYREQPVTGYDLSIVPANLSPAPPPPGVERFPGAGELVLSPALMDLLASDDGAGLRPRLSGVVVGTTANDGLAYPGELRFYRGAAPSGEQLTADSVATGWGNQVPPPQVSSVPYTPVLLTAGTAIVIVPLLIFVALMSRLGGPARDRRSAVIRLLGASTSQLRRITLVETAAATVGGLLLGAGGYLAARQAAPRLRIGPAGFYPDDISPEPAAVLGIMLVVPALAVGAAWLASRRVIVEPLGIVRAVPTRSRRPILGLTLVVVGALAMFGSPYRGALSGWTSGVVLMSVAIVALLTSVALLLPWALDRLARHIPSPGMACQLAVRRLQLDSFAPSLMVAGISVVLAGAIALQSVLALVAVDQTGAAPSVIGEPAYRVFVSSPTAAELTEVVDLVAGVEGVAEVTGGVPIGTVAMDSETGPARRVVVVAPCRAIPEATDCRDGDAFTITNAEQGGVPDGADPAVIPGTTVTFGVDNRPAVTWQMPTPTAINPDPSRGYLGQSSLILTPGALGAQVDGLMRGISLDLRAHAPNPTSAAADQLRTAMSQLTWRAKVSTPAELTGQRAELATTAQTGLRLGAALTLLVTVAGLFLMTIEHVKDRRRALTLTFAAGVPRGLIAASLVVGAALPIVAGVLLACVAGSAISAYLSTLIGGTWHPAWGTMAMYSAGAVCIVLLVTIATIPVLVARLTRPDGIRTG